jgi:transposase InsO family protein
VKYAWIQEQRDVYPVVVMCEVLEVSPSGYYAWCSREPSPRQRRLEAIAAAVEQSHRESDSVYGYRKVHEDLQERQIACCLETVRGVLREKGLFSRTRKKFVVTTDSGHALPVADNVLARDFTASAPDQKWVADITYVPTGEGWLYLAVVLDLFSRRIVGWSMSASLEAALVLDALRMALEHRRPGPGLVHHSDRGSQYASDAFASLLERHKIVCSMSRKGNCWDNAPAESFFGKLKTERVYGQHYATREEAKLDLFKYIELFYNRKRRHASLGYLSPVAFEERYLKSRSPQAA